MPKAKPVEPTKTELYIELADASMKVIEARKRKPTKAEILMAAALVGSMVVTRLQAAGKL